MQLFLQSQGQVTQNPNPPPPLPPGVRLQDGSCSDPQLGNDDLWRGLVLLILVYPHVLPCVAAGSVAAFGIMKD